MTSGRIIGFGAVLVALALVGGGSVIASCSSNVASDSPQAAKVAATDSRTEAQRIQAFLDDRYTAADVQHTFRTEFGETIDCIDFFAQPGAKALARRGTPITTIPTPPKPPHPVQQTAPTEATVYGTLDDNGSMKSVHRIHCRDQAVNGRRHTRGGWARRLHASEAKARGAPTSTESRDDCYCPGVPGRP